MRGLGSEGARACRGGVGLPTALLQRWGFNLNKELVAKDAQRRRSATTWGLLRWAAFVGLRQQRTRKALKPWGDAQRAWLAAPA